MWQAFGALRFCNIQSNKTNKYEHCWQYKSAQLPLHHFYKSIHNCMDIQCHHLKRWNHLNMVSIDWFYKTWLKWLMVLTCNCKDRNIHIWPCWFQEHQMHSCHLLKTTTHRHTMYLWIHSCQRLHNKTNESNENKVESVVVSLVFSSFVLIFLKSTMVKCLGMKLTLFHIVNIARIPFR